MPATYNFRNADIGVEVDLEHVSEEGVILGYNFSDPVFDDSGVEDEEVTTYKTLHKKIEDREGVLTPVDFALESLDDAAQEQFGASVGVDFESGDYWRVSIPNQTGGSFPSSDAVDWVEGHLQRVEEEYEFYNDVEDFSGLQEELDEELGRTQWDA